jgi:hypothetical protein
VVGGAGVEAPAIDLLVAGTIAEEDASPWLVEVEERSGDRRGRGVRLDAPMSKEQSRLVTLLRLRDVGLAASWLSAILGPMAKLAAVVARVVSCRLLLASGAALGASTGITLGTSLRRCLGVFARLAALATLVTACRGRRLPLLLVTSAGLPLLPSEEELPANGDWSRGML